MLGNLSINIKILAIIAFLVACAAGISATAYFGFNALSEASDRIELTAVEVRRGAQLNRSAVELSREEFRIAADTSQLASVRAEIEEHTATFEERLGNLKSTADPQQKTMIAEIEGRYQSYMSGLKTTLEIAADAGAIELSEAQQRVVDAVRANRENTAALREKLREFVTYTDNKGSRISDEASALAESRTNLLVAIAVLATVVGLAAGLMMARFGIVQPIKKIVDCLRRLADGDLETEVSGTERKDEVGDIAKVTLAFKENLVRTRQLEAQAEESEKRAEEKRKTEMTKLADDFESSIGEVISQLGAASEQLTSNATSMSAAAEEANNQAMTVSSAAEQASANVQTVASASEELSSSITEVAQQIQGTSKLAGDAAREAEKTGESMEHLRSVVSQVEKITSMISDIAEQTNLLALNATIEAARAGEAGKGFAVVANEVKQLAQQTARATDEITQQIEGMTSASTNSIEAVERISEMVRRINENSGTIAAAAEEQGAATSDIASNVSEAAQGTSAVSESITGVTQAAAETGRMSHELTESASLLNEQAGTLKSEVNSFLLRVRAA